MAGSDDVVIIAGCRTPIGPLTMRPRRNHRARSWGRSRSLSAGFSVESLAPCAKAIELQRRNKRADKDRRTPDRIIAVHK